MIRWVLFSIYEVCLMVLVYLIVIYNYFLILVMIIKQFLWKVYGVSFFMFFGLSELIKNGNLYLYFYYWVGQLGLIISVGL